MVGSGGGSLVAARRALMRYQCRQNIGRTGGVKGCQYNADRAIRAPDAQNYRHNCSEAD